MPTYRVVVLEDSPDDCQLLLEHISRVPFLSVVAAFSDPLTALPFLLSEPVDLLLLDLHLPGLSGFSLLRSLPHPPAVILTTSSLADSLEAFDVGVVDYVVKPIRYERFLRAVNRVLTRQPERPPHPADAGSVLLKQGHDLVRVPVDAITHIEAVGTYSKLYRTNQPPLLVSHQLSDLLAKLPAARFVRVHRSYVVAVDRISRLASRQLFVADKPIPVGRTYQQALHRLLHGEG